MNEKTRKKLIYIALVGAVIYGVVNLDPGSDKAVEPSPAQGYLDPSPGNGEQPGDPELAIDIDSAEALSWGKDPFRIGKPQHAPVATETVNFELSGIVYSPENPMAIINSRPVKEGDVISRARVVGIERTSVTLQYQGKEVQLTVSEG
jgi:hypothetical protein